MNQKTLAAALKVALAVSSPDGLADKELDVFKQELKSYHLTPEQHNGVIDQSTQMDLIEAINILRASDADTRREAEALTLVTTIADGELSDKELGALSLMWDLCSFEKMTVEEAHKILCF